MGMRVEPETPLRDAVAHLLEEADARSAALYPTESRHGLPAAELARLGVRFFVARLDGAAAGCGGYLPTGDGNGEVKRLFVTVAARGRGLGRAIMERIEAASLRDGIACLQLETGGQSVEALALYHRLGYRRRGPFGAWQPDPLSVFMEKRLA